MIMNTIGVLDSAWRDLKFGARLLRLNPGFAIVAILSLALGVGANTAIFQLLDAVRIRTLPVHDPQQLVAVRIVKTRHGRTGNFTGRNSALTNPLWENIRNQPLPFSTIFAWGTATFELASGGDSQPAAGMWVSGDFFAGLGVGPLIGRVLTAADDRRGCGGPGAVLSYAFWQRRYGGSPGVVGTPITLNGHPTEIIGVTPASFYGVEVGRVFDLAVPICAEPILEPERDALDKRHEWWLAVLGRLKPGVTIEQASTQLKGISPGLFGDTVPPTYTPQTAKDYKAFVLGAVPAGTGTSQLRRQYETPLWMLLSIAGLVLLIACGNLANLMLARASAREREIAVRLAIGASRWRLVRQLLAESALLAGIGTALGAVLAQALSRGLLAFISTAGNPLFVGMTMDWRVLGFAVALAILTCLLFGLAPALRATHLSPASVMRAGGRSMTSSRERFSLRRTLVATQVALSLVLLVGALLFVRSLRNLLTTEAGFRAEGILTVNVDFARAQYPKERRMAVYRELHDQLAAIPGVVSAAQALFTPVSGSGWNNDVGPDNTTAAASGKLSFCNRVGQGYFRTMGTSLLAGREFDDRDTVSAPKVAIVNEMFARKFMGGGNPVGRTFHLESEAGKPEPLFQIVGLVRNTKYYELREDFLPIAFFTTTQDDDPGPGATFVLRVVGLPGGLTSAVKTTLAKFSPAIGVQFQSFSAQVEESLLRERLMATLSGGFGLLAGLLATLGLYGVIAYMVARRRNEIGVRIALGADRSQVIRLVLREALLLLAFGLTSGVVIALWAGRAASTLLFGLQPYDPVSMSSAVALLAAIALAASYGPARRAAALEPMVALRDE